MDNWIGIWAIKCWRKFSNTRKSRIIGASYSSKCIWSYFNTDSWCCFCISKNESKQLTAMSRKNEWYFLHYWIIFSSNWAFKRTAQRLSLSGFAKLKPLGRVAVHTCCSEIILPHVCALSENIKVNLSPMTIIYVVRLHCVRSKIIILYIF